MRSRSVPLFRGGATAILAGVLVATLGACAPTGDESETVTPSSQPVYPVLQTYPDVPVIPDVLYGTAGDEPLLLDVCYPPTPELGDDAPPRAAIVSIHGGSWTRGDKSSLNWRSVCQWFASEGFVTVSINYRLSPGAVFPAQLDDAKAAVAWLREPEQVRRYNIDPERIGAFGGSAGGNLAALVGTSGTGPLTEGSRVAAVAELSGPSDVREPIETTGGVDPDFSVVQLAYLGCRDFDSCDRAAEASPITLIDESDPPFFVAHSIDEFIPLAQSERFVEELRTAGIDTTFVTVEGTLHSIGMLDADMKRRILAFYRDALG